VSIVIVLHAATPGHFAGYDPAWLLPRLAYAKRLELERRDPAAREAALAGIALALASAERLRGGPAPISDLRFPMDDKPAFDGGPFFSISHTDGRVACAACPDFDCGFDFEFIPVGADAAARARLARWTAIEAVLKAAGLGLREVQSVQVDAELATGTVGNVRYVLRALDLGAQYFAHLATPEPARDVRIEAVPATPAAPAA
jgi:phosphopantetheinyl transferase